MLESRIIPVLGIMGNGLYKTVRFSDPAYVGDPLNAVHIFNEKGVNELFVMAFRSSLNHEPVPHRLLRELAEEAFFPLGYGGGLNSVADCAHVISYGYEKVSLNSAAFTNPTLVNEVAKELGCSSVVVSLDVRKDVQTGAYRVYTHSGTIDTGLTIEQAARQSVDSGAGELLVHLIDHDGTYQGYDLEAVETIMHHVTVPIIVLGGASGQEDLVRAKNMGIQGIAASSMFVYYGKLRAVLINYPDRAVEI
ncbi:MAG: imidazole glycerol phosphate synthase subunit HisF [Flavobacteriales bacterium]|nr:imidazole glycerol phosphate synthase subunit HisF [Flavobacteriales bacterium]